jgi:hypothetical protein
MDDDDDDPFGEKPVAGFQKAAQVAVPVLAAAAVVVGICLRKRWPKTFAQRPDRMVVATPGSGALAAFGSVFVLAGICWFYSAAGSTFGGGVMLIGPSIFILVGLSFNIARVSLFDIDKRDGKFKTRSVTCLCCPGTSEIPLSEIAYLHTPVTGYGKHGTALYSMCLEKKNGQRVPLETGSSNIAIATKQESCRKINEFLGLASGEGNTGVAMMSFLAGAMNTQALQRAQQQAQQQAQQPVQEQPIMQAQVVPAQVVQSPLAAGMAVGMGVDHSLGQLFAAPGMPQVRGIFCAQCGTKNDVDGDGVADGKFCNGCGSELTVKGMPVQPQVLPVPPGLGLGGGGGAPKKGGDLVAKLQQLADLKAAGALSEAEYLAAKQSVLSHGS